MKRICFLFSIHFVLIYACAQKECTLIFRSDEGITVHVYKPIDDTFNFSYISDKLELKPNISIRYEIGVNDFEVVMCRFSTGDRYNFIVLPGDHIEINCIHQKIIVSGNNAEGHNYYNDDYINRGLGYYYFKIDTIFKKYITDNIINYDSISYCFWKELILPYQNELKKMEISRSITPKFSSILAKNLYFDCCSLLDIFYLNLKFNFSKEDIRNIIMQLNQFYDTPYALSSESKKLNNSSIINFYYRIIYKNSDDKTKEKLIEGYDKDCFGRYQYYLMASDSLQLREFGTRFIEDLQNGTNYFNHEKMLDYLSKKFPASEYVSIIRKMMTQSQSVEKNNEIIIVKDSISSIKELMQLPGIKGKYVYIDLWETACVPCVYEFQFNDDVHKLFAQYNNLVPVYISIDKDRELWESRVKKFNLNGYNIMASKSLNEDIGMEVYHAKQVGYIPRYLLLDPEGNIINDNLPRPSKSSLLKPVLANALK